MDDIDDFTYHTRPWGQWEVLLKGKHYKVKRLLIRPGQSLSKQYHEYRDEHWTVVDGQGILELEKIGTSTKVSKVIAIGDILTIHSNVIHKLYNTSETVDLDIIEVQIGNTCSEHDIKRLD